MRPVPHLEGYQFRVEGVVTWKRKLKMVTLGASAARCTDPSCPTHHVSMRLMRGSDSLQSARSTSTRCRREGHRTQAQGAAEEAIMDKHHVSTRLVSGSERPGQEVCGTGEAEERVRPKNKEE